jgi:hypothetical protein
MQKRKRKVVSPERDLRLKLEKFYLPRTLFPCRDAEVEETIRQWMKIQSRQEQR